MCLETVSKRKPKPEGFGWKVFYMRSDGCLTGDFITRYRARPIGEWLGAEDYESTYGNVGHKPYYSRDWHIFKKEKDAKEWSLYRLGSVCRKVEYKKAHTQGNQKLHLEPSLLLGCVVAKEIKILPEGK